jgi:parallel beta-helix repeat protein
MFANRATQEDKAATVIVAKDGTGDTDDIKEALLLLPISGGKIIVKEGTYILNSKVIIDKSNVTIEGFGSATIFSASFNDSIFHIYLADYVILRNFTILCNHGSTSQIGVYMNGVALDNVTKNILDGLIIFYSGGYSIYLNYTDFCTVTDCYCYNSDTYGVYIYNSQHAFCFKNIIRESTLDSFVINNSNKCIISNNITEQGSSGIILLDSDYNVINSNNFLNPTDYGVNISNVGCNSNLVMGNFCQGESINDLGTNTRPNGASGDNNLSMNDLNWCA